ncbi:hypothetical protein [Flavobacterium sp. HJJ]|uniref:hypothetical protein n=1 Tax=Flavobacterium sp. HJJ TaxID=2783792 RepID=UPI00188D2AE1|nr:hypothetical protein [Flavobacterium sp. HJJ]MBF4472604.1 hypothetical protein [Flavobacterium sp. HJJ]
MDTKKIYDEDGKGFTRVFFQDKIEKVNPIEHYKAYELKKRATVFRDLLYSKNPILTSGLDDDFFIKKAEEDLVGFFEEKEKIIPHDNFLKLLSTTRKKDQEKLLRGMTLNPDELFSLIIKSYKDFGFLYSTYHFENLPKGLEGKKLPKLIHIKGDETIEKVGDTDLSDGQLKNIIIQRNVIVSHFFELGDVWHCFFVTYNSIAGRENHKNGQAHLHYISSGFAISKDDFIESMRTGNYKATNIHIDLLDYGNQANES